MLPPNEGPPLSHRLTNDLDVWARLEGKSLSTEADLLRLTGQADLGAGWSLVPLTESLVAWLLAFFEA